MTYIIVANQSVQKQVEEVNDYIAHGFVPQGGSSSAPVNGGVAYVMVQAMVKLD